MKNRLLFLISLLLTLPSAQAKSSLEKPKITGIASVAFYTQDLTQKILFYTDYLGFKASSNFSLSKDTQTIEINKNQTVTLIQNNKPNGNRLAYFSL